LGTARAPIVGRGGPTKFTQLDSLDPELVLARVILYRASENVLSALTAASADRQRNGSMGR
jgi:hypothetical protein